MTLKEKIEVMEAFDRGEAVEHTPVGTQVWQPNDIPRWDWHKFDYRIKPKQKQTVVIEKWLCYDNLAESYSIVEESNIDGFINDDRAYLSKVRLLDTYEVTL